MTDEEEAMLRSEIQSLWAAIRALNQNDMNLCENVLRMSRRMALHEAYQASEEMDQPRVSH